MWRGCSTLRSRGESWRSALSARTSPHSRCCWQAPSRTGGCATTLPRRSESRGRARRRSSSRRVRAMDPDQLAAVLNALAADWRLFFELLAATGCRIGEALELRWRDVDFGAKRLHISRQVYHGAV